MLTKLYLIFIYIYHYVDGANHAFGGPNHDDSVRVDAPTTAHIPQPSSTMLVRPLQTLPSEIPRVDAGEMDVEDEKGWEVDHLPM